MAAKHTISCFEGTLDGWNKDSPEKKHVRESSLLHQFQQNLNKYEDEGIKIHKSKHEIDPVRLPLLTNTKSNINLEACRFLRASKNEPEIFIKKALPLRMKTLMIYEKVENENNEVKHKKNMVRGNQNKEKFRKKVIVNFERVKQMGRNCLEFSDEMFFKDTLNIREKSKSVKLYPILK